jgi:hypothetical protein
MTELPTGTRVRARVGFVSGYGRGRQAVDVGAEGTVRGTSRHLRYTRVEWDAGFECLARPGEVDPTTLPPIGTGVPR